MGLKNTQRLRTVGRKMADLLSLNNEKYEWELINEWNAALNEYEELLNKRKDKKNRMRDAKKLAKARGENKG